MEGSSAPTWVPFTSWLEQQRGEHPSTAPSSEREGAAESSSEGPSSRGSSDSETSFRADDVERASGRRYVTESSSNRQPQRHPVSASLARDCRMETRLVDGCGRARQEMTIMLAAPGTPLHKSPFVTAKQAGSLLAALYDPLVQVSVGRLTRRLEDPSMLRPTQDRGTLGLWLLPNDDLSLVWQGRTASADETAQTAARVHPSLALRSGNRCTTSDAMAEVVVWEELARFPASRHTSHDEPCEYSH